MIKSNDWKTAVLAGFGATCLSLMLLIVFADGPFTWLRHVLGLDYFISQGGGVYADCSNPKNRDNKFCSKDYSSALKPGKGNFYKSPKDWVPFSLSD